MRDDIDDERIDDGNETGNVLVIPEEYGNLRLMVRELAFEAELEDGDSNDFVVGLMENILAAATEEELFQSQDVPGLTASKDFLNHPFVLKADGIEWKRSSQRFINQKAFPFYAILTVTSVLDGEEYKLDAGGKTIVCVLYKLPKLGAFDQYPDGRQFQFIGKEVGAGTAVILQPLNAAKPRGKKA